MSRSITARLIRFISFAGLLISGFFGHDSLAQIKVTPEEQALEKKMIDELESIRMGMNNPSNNYASDAKLRNIDSLIPITKDPSQNLNLVFRKAYTFMEAGREQEAVTLFERIAQYVKDVPASRRLVIQTLGLAYLRLAERTNCINMHSAQACIMPIMGSGIQQNKQPARKAIECFETSLKEDPNDLDTRWLLNIAYMVIGAYPSKVPKEFLVPGLDAKSAIPVKPFRDIAPDLGVDVKSTSGGMIVDDFDNDGYLDMVSSAWGLNESMHYFRNKGDGRFADLSIQSGLSKFKGGLNICQTDYNNDGFTDIFILRGGWQGVLAGLEQPNSLIRNNGDGTFTDVTYAAGLFSLHPTQTGSWNDFNNDGWLDLFIGNETITADHPHPCELYINNKNGTFTNVAASLGLNIVTYVKAVASGDYDNDGWADVFLSTFEGGKFMLHNESAKGNGLSFKDVTQLAGFGKYNNSTFPAWFFDYDNDGWLDLFMCDYNFERPLSYYAAKEALTPSYDPTGKPMIFHNNKDGTFRNMTLAMDINQSCFAMGSNFGDIDNDGYLDFYLGTGNPSYQSVIPNRLYKNVDGNNFVEVTNAARVGTLQKGHGVSFADIDNDGDQDIITRIGGAFIGDAYHNALFMNPGQNKNNRIVLQLEGTRSNRPSIGARIRVLITENGKQRMVYREVNSGGSFGCSPLRQSIGIGSAKIIDEITITWPASGITQTYKNITPNQYLKITEGTPEFKTVQLKEIRFKLPPEGLMVGGRM